MATNNTALSLATTPGYSSPSDDVIHSPEMDPLCYHVQGGLDTTNVFLYLQLPLSIFGIIANVTSLLTLNISHSSPTCLLLKTLMLVDICVLVFYLPGRYYKIDPNTEVSAYVAIVTFPLLFGALSFKYWLSVSLAIMTFVNMCRPLKSPDWNTYKKVYLFIALSLVSTAVFNCVGFTQMEHLEQHQHNTNTTFYTVSATHPFYAYDGILHILTLYPATIIILLIFTGPVLGELRNARHYNNGNGNNPTLQTATVVYLLIFTLTHAILSITKILQLIFHALGSCDNVVQTADFCGWLVIFQCGSNLAVFASCSEAFRNKLTICYRKQRERRLNEVMKWTNEEEEELVQI